VKNKNFGAVDAMKFNDQRLDMILEYGHSSVASFGHFWLYLEDYLHFVSKLAKIELMFALNAPLM
jgi:hypothetical protein